METGKDGNGDASSPARTRTEASSPGRPDTRVPSIPGKESTADSVWNSRPRRTAGLTRSTRSSSTIKKGSASGRTRRQGRCKARSCSPHTRRGTSPTCGRGVYGQINVYGVTTKSERYERSYWTRTAAGNGIGGRKAPVPYGS